MFVLVALRLLIAAGAVVIGTTLVLAVPEQGAPSRTGGPPALSEMQRLQLTTVGQRIEIAVLKAQAAQRDFDAAVADRAALVRSLWVEGFELDLSTLSYRPATDAVEPR
jgi:hypothetical protein